MNQPEGLTAGATRERADDQEQRPVPSAGAGCPYFSEFSPSGKLLFNAKLPGGVGTYRAYRLPWNPDS